MKNKRNRLIAGVQTLNTTKNKRLALLASMPVGLGVAYALGGATATAAAAVAFPAALALGPLSKGVQEPSKDWLTGLMLRDCAIKKLDVNLATSARKGFATGAIVIEIDRFRVIEEKHSRPSVELLLRIVADRIRASVRESDDAVRLDGAVFGVLLSPIRRLNLEAAIQLSARIQQAIAAPIPIDGANVYLTASAGFCLASRVPDPTGEKILQAATTGLIEAQRHSPGAIRSYSDAMQTRIMSRSDLIAQVSGAMERGEIRAFFQPQVATKFGELTGLETLARWKHPERGLIPPIEFLPALEEAGLMDKLAEIMVRDALGALYDWDRRSLYVPRIGVNFSSTELRDPGLVEKLKLELDRFELEPCRLAVEVLETVVAEHEDDQVIQNLSKLAELGCRLDLDDFGTGHASITSIRRYSIERIKIDRSFITRIDQDAEQQKMVAAILTMAERLGLETLAEGVETAGEHEMLATLGCGHIQGFGIARPMPREETETWIRTHLSAHRPRLHAT